MQEIIEERSGGDYSLKYPQNGTYRSAIIDCDLDADGSSEAIALYSPQNEEGSSIHMLIMDEKNGKFEAVGEFISTNSEVERVCTVDMNGDGTLELIVGWSNYGSNINQLTAYGFNNGNVKEILIGETYSDMVIFDINSDKKDDIVLLSLGSSEVEANARILKLADSGSSIYATSEVKMNSSVTKYALIQSGKISEDTFGIIIDGILNDATLTTEVLYYDFATDMLNNPLYTTSGSSATSTSPLINSPIRTVNTLSKDINDDGIIEFPITLRLPSSGLDNSKSVCNAFDWSTLNIQTGLPETSCTTIADYNNGYYFIVPPTWHGKYTAVYDSHDASVTLYHWDNSERSGDMGSAAIKLRVFDESAWSEDGADYKVIVTRNEKAFAYRMLCEEQDYMYLSAQQVKTNFSLIAGVE
ncbi:MAG: VCBS repeat-containing protein [Clostridia bacterium]|nr:VCBS repeat-containing protein [Clostridia bacterium]